MKKAALISVLLCAGCLAALPWINGMVMERFVNIALVQMNHNLSGVRFDLVSYHRGYARTVAEWKLVFGGLAPLAGVREIRFTEEAAHGWTGVTSETRLDKNDWYARWMEKNALDKDPLSICTQYTLWGAITTTIGLDALTLKTENRHLAVKGLDLVLTADRSFDRVKAVAKVETLLAEDPASEMDVAVSRLEIAAETASDQNRENMDLTLNAAAGDVRAGGKSLSTWTLGARIRQMDIRAYGELGRLYSHKAGQVARILWDPALSPEQRNRELKRIATDNRFQAMTHMEKMLKKGFGLDISPLDITLPGGRITGNFSVSLVRDMSLAGFLPVALRPDLILGILSLVSRMELSGEFLELAPYLTSPLFHGMKTGIFVQTEGRLLHQARTLDKKLYLNGQVVDLGGE